MKNFVFIALMLGTGFLFLRATTVNTENAVPSGDETGFTIPEDVQGVIDNSCYGCHNTGSRNEKGRKKLSFDELSTLPKAKLIGKLSGIAEVVTDGDMPPKKVLADHPEMALTETTAATLTNWANTTAEDLLKK